MCNCGRVGLGSASRSVSSIPGSESGKAVVAGEEEEQLKDTLMDKLKRFRDQDWVEGDRIFLGKFEFETEEEESASETETGESEGGVSEFNLTCQALSFHRTESSKSWLSLDREEKERMGDSE